MLANPGMSNPTEVGDGEYLTAMAWGFLGEFARNRNSLISLYSSLGSSAPLAASGQLRSWEAAASAESGSQDPSNTKRTGQDGQKGASSRQPEEKKNAEQLGKWQAADSGQVQ